MRALAAVLLLGAGAGPARAFLGVGDTFFVTVIANPAEAANWAAELSRLTAALQAAQGTLATVGELRAYAGDPRAAVAALGDLAGVSTPALALARGPGTDADLLGAWQALGDAGRLAAEARLLASGPGASMEVFGQPVTRDPALYGSLAGDLSAAALARGQVTSEQAVRSVLSGELTAAWSRFRSAATESQKQAILAEISELQAQDQVMGARRAALMSDLDLADREERDGERVRAQADDERLLAQSAALNGAVASRAQAAESDRIATLAKAPAAAAANDYSGLKVWTTADTGGAP